MKLKDVDAILEIIDDITEIRGTTYIELVERIEKLPTRAVIHDCNGCMGAAYNPRDCETCEKVQITGKDGEKNENNDNHRSVSRTETARQENCKF